VDRVLGLKDLALKMAVSVVIESNPIAPLVTESGAPGEGQLFSAVHISLLVREFVIARQANRGDYG
jgi:hypothetical protein